MKPHKLIEPWKGDKRFGEMARRAAALKKGLPYKNGSIVR